MPKPASDDTRRSESWDLVTETRKVFEPRAGRPLSEEDCHEIHRNLTGFIRVLSEWKRKADAEKAADGDGAPEE